MLENMVDGQDFINNMVRDAEALKSYSLIFETITFKKGKSISEKGKLYFKKPKLMRLEEIGDYNHGAVAVIGRDGKARAHAGGVIGFIVLSMSATDKQLNAANGDRMIDSDFASLANLLKERLKKGNAARVSAEPVFVEALREKAFVLELYKPAAPMAVLKRIYVDAGANLPLRWDDYDYTFPCSSTWWDVKRNVELQDKLFEL